MDTQNINVKNTYVATVKKEVVSKALSFYKEDISSTLDSNDIFPKVEVNSPSDVVFPPVEPEIRQENTLEETTNNDIQEEQNVGVELPIASSHEVDVNSVSSNVVENNEVGNISKEETLDNVNITAEASVIPEIPQLNILEPITDSTSNDLGINNNIYESNNIVNNPIRFDASHETNLLSALDENNSGKGNITMTTENANIIREFGVDEPVIQESNPNQMNKMNGFINSKVLLVVVVLFFLASCVFLGYEIYNYFILSKV